MIAELNESNRPQFLAAVRGRPYFGDILPVHLAVFGRSGALMRFYVADGSAAVQLKGRSAVLCGPYDAEETGAFLRMPRRGTVLCTRCTIWCWRKPPLRRARTLSA